MQCKGQISLDLIVALLAFLVMVQVVLSITGELEKSQQAISLQNQERAIAESVAGKLSQIPTLSANSASSEISFQTPYLLAAGKPKQDCNIQANKTENPAQEVAVSVEVQYSLRNDSEEQLKTFCATRNPPLFPQVKLSTSDGREFTFQFDLSNGLQTKVMEIPLTRSSFVITLAYYGDCTDGWNEQTHSYSGGSVDLDVKSLIISGKVMTPQSNQRLYSNGDSIIFPINRQGLTACPFVCSAGQVCPGDWLLASDSDNCCSMPCVNAEVQVSNISLEKLAQRTSVSVPANLGFLVSNSSFNCGETVKCSNAGGSWVCRSV